MLLGYKSIYSCMAKIYTFAIQEYTLLQLKDITLNFIC